jgi:hypothetical protein
VVDRNDETENFMEYVIDANGEIRLFGSAEPVVNFKTKDPVFNRTGRAAERAGVSLRERVVPAEGPASRAAAAKGAAS